MDDLLSLCQKLCLRIPVRQEKIQHRICSSRQRDLVSERDRAKVSQWKLGRHSLGHSEIRAAEVPGLVLQTYRPAKSLIHPFLTTLDTNFVWACGAREMIAQPAPYRTSVDPHLARQAPVKKMRRISVHSCTCSHQHYFDPSCLDWMQAKDYTSQ